MFFCLFLIQHLGLYWLLIIAGEIYLIVSTELFIAVKHKPYLWLYTEYGKVQQKKKKSSCQTKVCICSV